MSEKLIELRNVSRSFSGKEVLREVNFVISKGDNIGILGASGSGKTTLLRLILGIYAPSSGELIVHGKSLKKKIGFASQEDAFYPRLSVFENILFFGALYGIPAKQLKPKIPEILSLVRLKGHEHAKARNLSGGMKRRLGIALALVHNPQIVIFDEPTSGLDMVLQKHIWDIIADIKKTGKTIIISTHSLDIIQKRCSSVLFVHEGSVYDNDIVNEIMKTYRFASFGDMFEAYVQ